MNFKELQEIFDNNNLIIFKLYSLEYVIEKDGNDVFAYATNYSERKYKYSSLKDATTNFKIYSEPLINQIKNIELIDKDD